MKFSEAVKPISYLKTHASEVVRDVSENQKTLVITHNGEAKVILQDVKVYEKTQESLALLKILALSGKEIRKGKYRPIKKSFESMRNRIDEFKQGQNEI
ncbi:MAG TPA: type II toxin-antitoxin system Phd/YefM family antitoxin [Ignavibacteriaceae bacterium]|nr:type II toxin-antitoxin system Phd/YefM family antitoxin [Ignavibacteriaceae bacterium]